MGLRPLSAPYKMAVAAIRCASASWRIGRDSSTRARPSTAARTPSLGRRLILPRTPSHTPRVHSRRISSEVGLSAKLSADRRATATKVSAQFRREKARTISAGSAFLCSGWNSLQQTNVPIDANDWRADGGIQISDTIQTHYSRDANNPSGGLHRSSLHIAPTHSVVRAQLRSPSLQHWHRKAAVPSTAATPPLDGARFPAMPRYALLLEIAPPATLCPLTAQRPSAPPEALSRGAVVKLRGWSQRRRSLRPSTIPSSKTVTTLGWLSLAGALASR